MEVLVDGVYFGNSEIYLCNSAILSKFNVKLTLTNSFTVNTKEILIKKKHIINLKAPTQSPTAFICFKLKDIVCQEISELLEFDKIGVKFNSRSTDETEVWMIIFYHFTNFEVPRFLASNYILQKNYMPYEDQAHFLCRLTSNAESMLWYISHTILALRRQEGAAMPQVCVKTLAMILPLEDRIIAKKLVIYLKDVNIGKAVQGMDFEVEFMGEAFSPWDMKEMIASYKSCLVCTSCGGEALLKCGLCKVTRYCARDCQVKDFKKHKGDCSKLGTERKVKEKQGSLVMQQPELQSILVEKMENWERKVPFEVWDRKFTDMVHKSARESIRKDGDIIITVNCVTSFLKM